MKKRFLTRYRKPAVSRHSDVSGRDTSCTGGLRGLAGAGAESVAGMRTADSHNSAASSAPCDLAQATGTCKITDPIVTVITSATGKNVLLYLRPELQLGRPPQLTRNPGRRPRRWGANTWPMGCEHMREDHDRKGASHEMDS